MELPFRNCRIKVEDVILVIHELYSIHSNSFFPAPSNHKSLFKTSQTESWLRNGHVTEMLTFSLMKGESFLFTFV